MTSAAASAKDMAFELFCFAHFKKAALSRDTSLMSAIGAMAGRSGDRLLRVLRHDRDGELFDDDGEESGRWFA